QPSVVSSGRSGWVLRRPAGRRRGERDPVRQHGPTGLPDRAADDDGVLPALRRNLHTGRVAEPAGAPAHRIPGPLQGVGAVVLPVAVVQPGRWAGAAHVPRRRSRGAVTARCPTAGRPGGCGRAEWLSTPVTGGRSGRSAVAPARR